MTLVCDEPCTARNCPPYVDPRTESVQLLPSQRYTSPTTFTANAALEPKPAVEITSSYNAPPRRDVDQLVASCVLPTVTVMASCFVGSATETAVMSALPLVTAVTIPVALIVATLGDEELHVTDVLIPASPVTVAVSCCV